MDFDTKPFLDCAHILMRHDETELALKVLNNIPAYWRDNIPQDIAKLKSQIKASIIRPIDLLSDNRELPKSDEWSKEFLNATARGATLKDLVKEYNEKGQKPHIFDMGPGDFTFAIGLSEEKFDFYYTPYTLNKEADKAIHKKLGIKCLQLSEIKPTVFVAYEIIEHLSNIDEIRQCYDRIKEKPEYILLSTPKYTFGEGSLNWMRDGAHHLRAYSPKEFVFAVMTLFPEYDIQHIDSDVQVVRGKLRQ